MVLFLITPLKAQLRDFKVLIMHTETFAQIVARQFYGLRKKNQVQSTLLLDCCGRKRVFWQNHGLSGTQSLCYTLKMLLTKNWSLLLKRISRG